MLTEEHAHELALQAGYAVQQSALRQTASPAQVRAR